MLGNAVLSAHTLAWQDSMAFAPELEIPMDHLSIYQLNSAAALGDHPIDELRELITGRLSESARGGDWKHGLCLSESRLNDIRVNGDERAALLAGARSMGSGGRQTLLALEKTFAENGYGVPAIAILILLVVVVVAVISHDPA